MSEFNFSCPACGQNISGDTACAGTEINCPVCHAAIVVPSETAGPAGISPQTDTPPAWTGHNATTAAPRTSRLAIASLICSLASLVTCIGWIPGIICGHLAKSRIRRDSSLKGNGLATAGLIIGYLILVLEAGTAGYRIWSFSNAVKQGIANVRHDLATNNIIITRTQSTTVSTNDNPPMEPVQPVVAVTNQPQMEAALSGWTSDVSKVVFPDHPVDGKVHGMHFALKSAALRGANLRLNSENGPSLEIFGLDQPVAGQSYEIQPADTSANPRVKLTWNEGDVIQAATYGKGYGMKLQFAQVVNRKMSGKIYLCLPDDSKSYVAGTFVVRIPKSK
jgi:hypothetical protein